jgi:hypothetical protein
MARPTPFPEGTAERLKLAMSKARTKGEYKRWLCLWLRESLSLNNREVATALCWTRPAVRKLWWAYLHRGEEALRGPGRGGRRRQYLSWEQELALLHELASKMTPTSTIPAAEVQHAYEKALGHPVAPTTIYRMLARHYWRRQATGDALVPLHGWGPSRFPQLADNRRRPGS